MWLISWKLVVCGGFWVVAVCGDSRCSHVAKHVVYADILERGKHKILIN